jgi:ABC-type Mn2+/Zn2+ transport system ATPase subunit
LKAEARSGPAGSLHPHGVEEPPRGRRAEAPLVELESVSTGYGEATVLEEVSLKIWPGQFVAVVGPNGGGKTTLLRAILGTLPLLRGKVRFRGREGRQARDGRIGYVPQLETIDWSFPITVEEVILMGLYARNRWLGRFGKKERAKLQQVLERLNLAAVARRHIRELSGGQQQATFIARALIGEPELILLDEPTAGLDMRSRDDLIHFLHEINHQGVAVLITAHDLNWVAAHLPWVVCLNRRVVAEGEPHEVFTPAVLGETYRGEMVVFVHDGMVMVGEKPHPAH